MKLTEAKVKNAKPGDRRLKIADGGGLYLLVTPEGGKLWRWKFRYDGREKTMAFGAYPEVTLAEVRELHADGRKLLRSGVDPMEQRKAAKVANLSAAGQTFEAVALAWHEQWQSDKNPDYAADVKLRLTRDIFPAIGHLRPDLIEAPKIVAVIKKIEERGAREIASRSLGNVGQVFRYAIAHGLATRNPATDIKPGDFLKAVPVVNYARIEAQELPMLLRKIETYHGSPVTRLAIKLLALTFVRTSELIEARWSEFDFKGKRWTIPAERMKGTKYPTAHIVPLSEQAIDVLGMLHEITGEGELLFPGDWSTVKTMSKNTILKALDTMGYKGLMTGHGFRGLASTILHEHEFEHEHIELQLAHMKRDRVSASYNHAKYLKQRTAMMQWWADYLDKARQERPSTGLFAIAG
jgi:integrase